MRPIEEDDSTLPIDDNIVRACKKVGLTLPQTAYVLATTYHETAGTMKPNIEAYWMSENWRKKNLRYYPWYGRGYVQLTWRYNYKRASDFLGVDLMTDPDRALDQAVSTSILVYGMRDGWFTGKKLKDYINPRIKDYVRARKIVNGLDKANLISDYADIYEGLLIERESWVSWLMRMLKEWKS